VTEQRLSERELRAHYALSEALDSWESFEESSCDLLRRLGEAMDYPMSAMWLWDEEQRALTCRAFCHPPEVDPGEFEIATRRLKFPAGSGLAGRAWESRQPIIIPDVAADLDFRRPETAKTAGVESALVFPALIDDEAIAVLTFYSFDRRQPSARLIRTLTGIGRELGRFLGSRRAQLAPRPLSPREIEVLGLAAEGLRGPEIAEGLVLSPATVKTHFQNIYEKLGVTERSAAVAIALRSGLIT
jgi:DNA-binding CsgD family transcriptional regulator